jgi:hypothetical protein
MNGDPDKGDGTRVDELFRRYRELKLSYFPHWKVPPWEKREKEAMVKAFLDDLEAYLLKKHWSVERQAPNARFYRNSQDPSLLLEVKHYIDYFMVHTVYLVEIYLKKERTALWSKILADGELVFERLKRMG